MSFVETEFIVPNKIVVDSSFTSSHITYYDKDGNIHGNDYGAFSKPSCYTFDNNPISGLKISKDERKKSWDDRNYSLILEDPRGFRFVITYSNLCWIFNNGVNYVNGELIGEFVYSWIKGGDTAILMPTNSKEYIKYSEVFKKVSSMGGSIKTSDLVPGSLYKLKNIIDYDISFGGLLFNKSSDLKEAIFLGNVRIQKEFGKRFESKLLFKLKNPVILDSSKLNPKNEKILDLINNTVFFISKDKIEYEIEKNYLSEDEVNSLIHRFNISAYSWEFWNSKTKIIHELNETGYILGNYIEYEYACIRNGIYSSSKVNINRESVKFNSNKTEFDYYTSKYKMIHDSVTNTIREGVPDNIPNCKFSLVDGKLKIIKNYINLGKINSVYRDYKIRVSYQAERKLETSVFLDTYNLYPDQDRITVSIEEYEKENLLLNSKFSNIYYTTTDGYESDSLQQILSTNAGLDGLYSIPFKIVLPIKINK